MTDAAKINGFMKAVQTMVALYEDTDHEAEGFALIRALVEDPDLLRAQIGVEGADHKFVILGSEPDHAAVVLSG